MTVDGGEPLVAAHRAAGEMFTAGGVRSFVRMEGDGTPVLLVHGLPVSSYLYRKVLPELAGRGLRGVAFDLPGMGLADRPSSFDYRIAGLGEFAAAAVDALELGSFHLVVHDAGGPVGFELIRRRPDAIRSLTILDTMVEIPKRPFPGEIWARLTSHAGPLMRSPRLWRQLMRRVGVADQTALSEAEIDAHRLLALGHDDAAGYLRIMSAVADSRVAGSYADVVDTRRVPYPVQVLWGASDPILTLGNHGLAMLEASGLPALNVTRGRHYIQEDCAPLIASMVAEVATDGAMAVDAPIGRASEPGRRTGRFVPRRRA